MESGVTFLVNVYTPVELPTSKGGLSDLIFETWQKAQGLLKRDLTGNEALIISAAIKKGGISIDFNCNSNCLAMSEVNPSMSVGYIMPTSGQIDTMLSNEVIYKPRPNASGREARIQRRAKKRKK